MKMRVKFVKSESQSQDVTDQPLKFTLAFGNGLQNGLHHTVFYEYKSTLILSYLFSRLH